MITRFDLLPDELAAIEQTIARAGCDADGANTPEFCEKAALLAHELPLRLRAFLNDFRLREIPRGGFVLGGFQLKDGAIGPTPLGWDSRPIPAIARIEVFLMLVGSLLGDPFCFASQRNGRLIHDVLPLPGNECEQLGTGSQAPLQWHTEDAFHQHRADYVLLLCMRNPDRVATTVGIVNANQLSEEDRDVLRQPRFSIRPDESHQRARNAYAANHASVADSFIQIDYLNTAPDRTPLLFGNPEYPYIRIDITCMDVDCPGDSEAARALASLCDVVGRNLTYVRLEPGEILILDNYASVHGREPFRPRYDGADRWLKRILVSRNLRESRPLRSAPESRVIL